MATLDANDAGNMTVRPVQDQGPALDLMSVVTEEARDRNLTFPAVCSASRICCATACRS